MAARAVALALKEESIDPSTEIWRLSVDHYHAMIAAGILDEGDNLELLEGWLVKKMTKTRDHSLATWLTREALKRVVGTSWYVDSQEPVTTADSEPEPDVSVVRAELRRNRRHHPGPEDVALVVEVADSSLRRDRTWKKRLYAAAKIPTYWIINLKAAQIEVYTQPTTRRGKTDYLKRKDYAAGEKVPLVIGNRIVARLAVRDLLP